MKIDYLDKRFPREIVYKIFQIEELMLMEIKNILSYNFYYDDLSHDFILVISLENKLNFSYSIKKLLDHKNPEEIVSIIKEYILQNNINYERMINYENPNIRKTN